MILANIGIEPSPGILRQNLRFAGPHFQNVILMDTIHYFSIPESTRPVRISLVQTLISTDRFKMKQDSGLAFDS